MSWKALDWATNISVGSPTMRLILILLANKADENFSCYPSVRTLMEESCAARSTVLGVLKRLEAEEFITRAAQHHESGAQRSSRYLLNHPDAPHLNPRPDSGPPGPQTGRRESHPGTGGVQDLDPPGVQNPDPLNPPEEPPSEPSPAILLQSLPEPWRLSGEEAMKLSPAVEYALASGWTSQSPQNSSVTKTGRSPAPRRSPCTAPRRVTRAAESLAPAQDTVVRRVRRRAIPDHHRHTLPDGTEAAAFCPRCSPQKRPQSVDQKIANTEGR
jgi:hypothetical protein